MAAGVSKATGFTLFLLAVTAVAGYQNAPQLQSNASFLNAETAALDARGLLGRAGSDYTCRSGYSSCSATSSRCCPTGDSCCSNGYCASPGETCCTFGTCPSGWTCCGNTGHCAPVDGECCEGGYYCRAGYSCWIWQGEKVCCPAGGCAGENDSGSLGSTVEMGASTTAMETETETATAAASVTSAPETSTSTSTSDYSYLDWEYYYTTYYWTYWFYFWTSHAPYTTRTVTSTETTTRTTWSVHATDSGEASASLSSSVELYSFSTPYSATYLRNSVDAVLLSTGTATSSTHEGGGNAAGASPASAVFVSPVLAWVFSCMAVAIGGLAFGL